MNAIYRQSKRVDIVPGFSNRLHLMLDVIGHQKTGRYSYIAEITGMAKSNSRAVFVNDRPPKKQLFNDLLSQYLSTELMKRRDISVGPKEILEYLLSGSLHIANKIEPLLKSPYIEIAHIPEAFKMKLGIYIDKVAAENNVDVFGDIDSQQFEKMMVKLGNYLYKEDTELSHRTSSEIVKSSLVLATKELL